MGLRNGSHTGDLHSPARGRGSRQVYLPLVRLLRLSHSLPSSYQPLRSPVFSSRLTLGSSSAPTQRLPTIRNLDQPFPFDIRLYNRSYRFLFSDTSSPTNFTLLQPSVIVLCYDISSPPTLNSLQAKWKNMVEMHFNYDESLPVIVLGLKRDVRSKEDYDGKVRMIHSDVDTVYDESGASLNGRTFVYPQEALRVAQEMRCDRYCECSALTGEVCNLQLVPRQCFRQYADRL